MQAVRHHVQRRRPDQNIGVLQFNLDILDEKDAQLEDASERSRRSELLLVSGRHCTQDRCLQSPAVVMQCLTRSSL